MHHLHLLHVGRGLGGKAWSTLRGRTAEPEKSSVTENQPSSVQNVTLGLLKIMVHFQGPPLARNGCSYKEFQRFPLLPVHARILLLDHGLGFGHLSLKESK